MKTVKNIALVLLALLLSLLLFGRAAAMLPPALFVIAPSYTGGPDFATTVLGDPWDMNNAEDVDYTHHVNNITFNGIFHGEGDEGTVPDVAFYANSTTGIPTSEYYYLTYKLRIQPKPAWTPGTNGRIIYLEQFFDINTRHYSSEIWPPVDGSWRTYQFDLRSDLDGSPPLPSPEHLGWDWEADGAEALAIWPHEQWENSGEPPLDSPDWFEFDYVYLTGDNCDDSPADIYTIRWGIDSGTNWTPITATLYYDTDQEWDSGDEVLLVSGNLHDFLQPPIPPGYVGTFIPLLIQQSDGSGSGGGGGGGMGESYEYTYSYLWDTTGLSGFAYVWVEITDGPNTIRQLSQLPVYFDC